MNDEPFPKAAGDTSTTLSRPVTPDSAELNVPRKREREISLEPVSVDSPDSTRKDKQAAKKNRLASTEEDPDEAISGSPPTSSTMDISELSKSPPHETKMRLISRRVSDIKWKNGETSPSAEHQHEAGLTSTIEMDEPEVPTAPSTQETRGTRSMESVLSTEGGPQTQDDSEVLHAARGSKWQPSTDDATPPLDAAEPSGTLSNKKSMESIRSTSSTKRQREDEEDINPRETKRPSPPPAKDIKPKPEVATVSPSNPVTSQPNANIQPTATETPKFGGFAAFASPASPFAMVRGPSVFGSSNTPKATTPPASSSDAPSTPGASSSKTADSQGTKRTGFDAFASSTSPFATAAKRSKSPAPRPNSPPRAMFGSPAFGSPALGGRPMGVQRPKSPSRTPAASVNAFSSYATGGSSAFGGASPFALAPKASTPVLETPSGNGKASSDEEGDGQSKEEEKKRGSFGAILRSQAEEKAEEEAEDEKVVYTEQESLTTGEEDEETLYQVRSKLYTLDPSNSWKERGTGQLRINVRRSDGSGARLVMRKEAVHSLILNVSLFKGMSFAIAQDPRYIRFSALEDGKTTHYNLRVSNAKIAKELLSEVRINVPDS